MKEKGNYRSIHGEVVKVPTPPKGWTNSPEYSLEQKQTDEEIENRLGVRLDRNIQEILKASLLSGTEGRKIHLPL